MGQDVHLQILSVRKPRWLIIAANLWHNLVAKYRFLSGTLDSEIGATHLGWSTPQSVAYINRVFEDYLKYGGIDANALRGKRILEIGPGDNLGVALRFYAAGASQVVCLDKFRATRVPEQQIAIYRSLRNELDHPERARYDEAISLDSGVTVNQGAVHYVYGVAAEAADHVLEQESFDLIVSRAVMWEIYELDKALIDLDRLLRPGGAMIHKIACLDWMFRQEGYHPLEFMTVSDPIYRLMTRDSGKSNRRTIDYYRRALGHLGYSAAFHIVRVVAGEGEFPPRTTSLIKGVHYSEETLRLLREIRPRLTPQFRALSDEDLMVEDMFLVAMKTSPRASVEAPVAD
jgi:SAM-dependent methyltransferase